MKLGFSNCMPAILKIRRVIHAMIEMNNSQYKTKFNIQNNAIVKILINAKIQNCISFTFFSLCYIFAEMYNF